MCTLPYALIHPHQPYYLKPQKENYQDHAAKLVPKTHHAIARVIHNSCYYSHRKPKHSNLHHDKMQHLMIENVLGRLYPKSKTKSFFYLESVQEGTFLCNFSFTCIVTNLSSTITSFVRKSAPIVALYCPLNFLLTY